MVRRQEQLLTEERKANHSHRVLTQCTEEIRQVQLHHLTQLLNCHMSMLLTVFQILRQCNLTPGTVVGFKYLNFQNVTKVSVKTRGMCYYGGFDVLLTADGEPIGTVSAARGNEWRWQTTELAIPDGISAIYFRMKGYGTLSLAAAKFH